METSTTKRIPWQYEIKFTDPAGVVRELRPLRNTKAAAMAQGHWKATGRRCPRVEVIRWASLNEHPWHLKERVQLWEFDQLTTTWRSNGRPFRPRV